HVARAPWRFGRELLYEPDATLRHLLRRRAHDLEARAAARNLAREIDQRLRLVAVRREPLVFAGGIRRAEADELHAVVAPHERTHARGGRRVVRRREQLDV